MAVYQETHPRKDTVPRRTITKDDLDFLKELQTEMNTQDTMGTADPRFWAIRQSVDQPCPPDESDTVHFVNHVSGETVAHDLDGFVRHLKERYPDAVRAERDPVIDGWDVTITDSRTDPEDLVQDYVTEPDEIIDLLEKAGIYDYALSYTRRTPAIVPGTLFLTHRECEDHLRHHGHGYAPDAHAYAMTAVHSPQFERLVMLLQRLDWDALRPI